MDVGYLSEFAMDYSTGLKTCKTLNQLKEFITIWKRYAFDTFEIVSEMSEESFSEFKKVQEKVSHDEFMGREAFRKYGAIMAPDILVRVSVLSYKFTAPWGTAFIRSIEEGYIIDNGTYYEWRNKEIPK